jgi:hypothetical protein
MANSRIHTERYQTHLAFIYHQNYVTDSQYNSIAAIPVAIVEIRVSDIRIR